jgi:uncharacterized membrane-anchored protein
MPSYHYHFAAFALLCLGLPLPAAAQAEQPAAAQTEQPEAAPADQPEQPRQVFQSLVQQSGRITLEAGIAELSVGSDFGYLGPKDAGTFLVQLWGNPPEYGADTLGVLLPKDVDALGVDSWAVVIDYDESGYVSDSDANSIDYDDLLKDMQKELADGNHARTDQGYDPIALVGWAAPPRYDPATHKLYWAKRLRFGDSKTDTLNYNIRVLGRRGVLDLNIIASIDQLPMIEQRVPEILGMVDFRQGNTYAEYDSHVDKVAAYGIAGLIAGGVLAKVGFFKALLFGILAFKKVAIVATLAVFGAISAFFKRLFDKRPG